MLSGRILDTSKRSWARSRLVFRLAGLLVIALSVSLTISLPRALISSAHADDGSQGGGGNSGEGSGGADHDGGGVGTDNSVSDSGGLEGSSPAADASQSGHRNNFEPREVVVVAAWPDIESRARRMGFKLIDERQLSSLGFSITRLRIPRYLDTLHGLAMLRHNMPELIADVNSLYEPYRTQGVQVVSLPEPDYARRMINWKGSLACGAGFRVGMIDTGVAGQFIGLQPQRLHQQSFLDQAVEPADNNHGTAIADLLVGGVPRGHPNAGGLLPSADLYNAAVFERHNGRTEANAIAIASALDWMAQSHVPIVNISLSGDSNALLALAVHRAAEHGSILIAAASNGGPRAPPAYPAAYPGVIAATAIDASGSIYPNASQGDYVAFSAPGVRIWAPGPDEAGQYLTGTSFAAPFVTAAAALELMSGSPAGVTEVETRLALHAKHLGPIGRNPIYGYGLIQASHACPGILSSR